ncbi:MAG: signal peptide peptidase SppA [Syntrophobacteraceae bacterium]
MRVRFPRCSRSVHGAGLAAIMALTVVLCTGCIKPKITLFGDGTDPLEEYTLEGKGADKVLLLSIKGFIGEGSKGGLLSPRQSMVQEVAAQLKKAREDKAVKGLLLKVDSPGGSVTASDLLYHEILRLKEEEKLKIVAVLMGTAASGGYYVSLPADRIVAHPTTVTGSVGVISVIPKVSGMMEKLGLEVEVDKHGRNKDMGSPFRRSTPDERRILEGLVNGLGNRFMELVSQHRKLSPEALNDVATARIYLAEEALQVGLVDEIGYLDDAVKRVKKLAEIDEDAKLVVYRRHEHPEDTVYHAGAPDLPVSARLLDLGIIEPLTSLRSGLYYLWLPGYEND